MRVVTSFLPFTFKCRTCGAYFRAYSKRDGRMQARQCEEQGTPDFKYELGFAFSTRCFETEPQIFQVTGHVIQPGTHSPMYAITNRLKPLLITETEMEELINS